MLRINVVAACAGGLCAEKKSEKSGIPVQNAPSRFGSGANNAIARVVAAFATDRLLAVCHRQGRQNCLDVQRFMDWLLPVDWGELSANAIREYLSHRKKLYGSTNKTLKNIKSNLSTFCEFLIGENHLAQNPCLRISLRKEEKPPGPTIETRARLGQFLRSIKHRETRNAVLFDVAAGPRLSELCMMRWQDISADGKTILLWKTKSGVPRVVSLSRMARLALASQWRISGHLRYVFPARHTYRGGWTLLDKPCSANAMSERLGKAKAGWPEFAALPGRRVGRGFHLLRRTFASQLAQADTNLSKIKRWMGHTDIKMTEEYIVLARRYDRDIECIMERPPEPRRSRETAYAR